MQALHVRLYNVALCDSRHIRACISSRLNDDLRAEAGGYLNAVTSISNSLATRFRKALTAAVIDPLDAMLNSQAELKVRGVLYPLSGREHAARRGPWTALPSTPPPSHPPSTPLTTPPEGRPRCLGSQGSYPFPPVLTFVPTHPPSLSLFLPPWAHCSGGWRSESRPARRMCA